VTGLLTLALVLPLGGFHANEIPLARIHLRPAEFRRVQPFLWSDQKTDGQGHLDLADASDETMRHWFKQLAGNGVTALRLFPRARVDGDTLDLCGKLNPDLQRVFHRAFQAARPYGIRFLLQILPEPVITSYWNHSLAERYALPRYSRDELARLTPAQRRFLLAHHEAQRADYFTDPDVLACQKLYLEQALAWVAAEPQVFALEVYNEQGHSRPPPELARSGDLSWQDAEIRWTAEIVRFIHLRLPAMPVTISHPGYGIVGYDPLEWSRRSGVDFYSLHLYAGLCGEFEDVDFAAVTAASTVILRAGGLVAYPGEWGVLASPAPREVLRRAHRDAIWLTLLAGAPGFLQWTYDFVEEYRWPNRVFGSLPREFSPDPPPPPPADFAARWAAFASAGVADPPYFMLNRQRRSDPNLRRLYLDYRRSLDPSAAAPLRPSEGWQLAWLGDTQHRIWVAYLRSREIRAFGKHFLGVPVARPLRLALNLPPGRYRVSVIDLERNRRRRFRLDARGALDLSPATDSDYVVQITPLRPVFPVLNLIGSTLCTASSCTLRSPPCRRSRNPCFALTSPTPGSTTARGRAASKPSSGCSRPAAG
jgi:hypothetical protein